MPLSLQFLEPLPFKLLRPLLFQLFLLLQPLLFQQLFVSISLVFFVLLIARWQPFQQQVFQVHFSFIGVPLESSFLILIFLAFLFQ
jgi:hypothetical protein